MSSIRILFVCFILLLFFNSFTQEESSVSLENKAVVIRTVGVAFLGSGLTEDNAKTLAINDAKRSALERAGTYLESQTTVLNSKVEKDEIITFTGSLLKVKPLNFTRILVDNMFAIKAEIEATVDIKLLDQRIEDIRKDTSYREQMELQRKKIEELEAKIAILQSPENLKRNKDNSDEYEVLINELVENVFRAGEYFDLGYRANQEKKCDIALEYFNKYLEIDPTSHAGYNNRGVAYYGLDEYEKAISDFDIAISLKPGEAKYYFNRGYSYYLLGEHNSALSDMNQAVAIDPTIASFWYGRGKLYFDMKKFEEASLDLEEGIKLNPQFEENDIYFYCGFALQQLKQFGKAIQYYTSGISFNPDFDKYYFQRGYCNINVNKIREAQADFTKFLELHKTNDAYYQKAEELLNALSKISDESIKKMDQLLKSLPEGTVVDTVKSKGDHLLR